MFKSSLCSCDVLAVFRSVLLMSRLFNVHVMFHNACDLIRDSTYMCYMLKTLDENSLLHVELSARAVLMNCLLLTRTNVESISVRSNNLRVSKYKNESQL